MKRGMQPQGKVKRIWSARFAYAIGLIAADGYLSKDGRHISLTSKDKAQIVLFKKCLCLKTKVSQKRSGSGNLAYHTQFGDVLLYRFLEGIGLTSAKSKTIASVKVPDEYFFDFLRGYFDGDGSSYSYYDPAFPKSYRFYISFTSASPAFFDWLREELQRRLGVKGSISRNRNNAYVQLKYAKKEAIVVSNAMYRDCKGVYLRRKHLKIKRSLGIIGR